MLQRLLLIGLALLLVACRPAAQPETEAVASPMPPTAEAAPVDARTGSRAFGLIRNAHLAALGQAELPEAAQVRWALQAGPSNTCWQAGVELAATVRLLPELPRAKAARVFGLLKNAKLILLLEPTESMQNHVIWGKRATEERFKAALDGEVKDVRRLLAESCGR